MTGLPSSSAHQSTSSKSPTTPSSSSLQFVLYPSSTMDSFANSDSDPVNNSVSTPDDAFTSDDAEEEKLNTHHSKFQEEWWHTTFSLTNLTQSETPTTSFSPKFDKSPDNMTNEEILSILRQILNQKTVKLTPSICESLHHPTVLELFLSFLSRTPLRLSEFNDDNQNCALDLDRRIHPDLLKERDISLQPTIYSYRLMDALCSINPINSKFVEDHFEQIVQALFAILKVNSDGNFFHFKKLFESFLSRYSGLFLDSIVYSRQRHPLMFQLLPFIHHPPILSCLVFLLTYKSPENHEEITQRFVHLYSIGFWDCIFSLLSSSIPDLVSATVDLFHNFLEKLIEMDCAHHLFAGLATDPHIQDLWDSALHSSDISTVEATINVLHAILVGFDKRSEIVFYPIQKTETLWFLLAAKLSEVMVPHVGAIAHFFLSTKSPSMRFITLELIAFLLAKLPQNLDLLSVTFWKVCVTQFFSFPNPLCLPSIYKILTLAVEFGPEEVLQKVLVKQKLIHRLLDVFEGRTAATSTPPPSPPFSAPTSPTSPTTSKLSSSPDLRVFSILLLQHISIVAEIQEPRGYLFQLTRAHSRLRSAGPNLLKAIKEQLEFNYFWPDKLGKPPLPQVSPNKWNLDFLDMPQCTNLPEDVEISEEDSWLPKYALNIGLGSYFISHLEALLKSLPMKDTQRETYFKAMVHEVHVFQTLCDAGQDQFDLDTIKDETLETIANLALTDDKTLLSLSPEKEHPSDDFLLVLQDQAEEPTVPYPESEASSSTNDAMTSPPESSNRSNPQKDTKNVPAHQKSHPGDRIATIYD